MLRNVTGREPPRFPDLITDEDRDRRRLDTRLRGTDEGGQPPGGAASNGRDGLFLASGGGHDCGHRSLLRDGGSRCQALSVGGVKAPCVLTNLGGINDGGKASTPATRLLVSVRLRRAARRSHAPRAAPPNTGGAGEGARRNWIASAIVTRGGKLIALEPRIQLLEFSCATRGRWYPHMLLEKSGISFRPRPAWSNAHSQLRARGRDFSVEMITHCAARILPRAHGIFSAAQLSHDRGYAAGLAFGRDILPSSSGSRGRAASSAHGLGGA